MIRMMANFLGLTTFNKGISNYLHANSLSNANQDDLWSFLTAAGQVPSTKVILNGYCRPIFHIFPRTLQATVAQEDGSLEGKTVKEVMDTWTVQMGYPVININRWESNLQLLLLFFRCDSGWVSESFIVSDSELCQLVLFVFVFSLSCSTGETPCPWQPFLTLKLKFRRYDGSKSATARQER